MVINEPDLNDILYEHADVMTDYFLKFFGKLYICIGNYLEKVVAINELKDTWVMM